MNEPIVIREIVVNGRTLRAEPPVEVEVTCRFEEWSNGIATVAPYWFQCEDFPCVMFGMFSIEAAKQEAQRTIESFVEKALEQADRYRQRFKEVE